MLLATESSPIVTGWRVALVLLGLGAEAWNIVNMIGTGERASEHFAYFTVQSNLLIIVVFAWMLLRPAHQRPRWFDSLRGAATAYIVLAGLVYAVLLAQPDEVWSWNIEFTNGVQHRIVPLIAGLDWLLVAATRPASVARSLTWMLYPLAYLGCSWLRYAFVDAWVPYPFLDPEVHGGWAGLVLPTGQVLIAFVVGILLTASVGRLRARVALPRTAPRK